MAGNNGVGFCITLKIGIFIENINRKVDRLYPHIESSLMMHNLYETFPLKDNKKRFTENQRHLLSYVGDEVKNINKQIQEANKILKMLKFPQEILPVDLTSIKQAIDERFDEVFKEDKSQEISNQNLKLKLGRIISNTRKSIFDLLNYAKERETFTNLDKLENKYKKQIESAIDIYSFGHFDSAIFLLGRTLEQVLDDSIRLLVKLKKIKRAYPRKIKYINKIGILLQNKFIDERLFHELNTMLIDRNDTGHPTGKKYSNEECKNMIDRVIMIVIQLQKKLQ